MKLSTRLTQLMIVLIALGALALSGCDKNAKPLEAKEGARVYLDGLFYQVQLSRALNPKDTEDSFYLKGQPGPQAGESYFGVFVRVDNEDTKNRVTPISTEHMKITTASGAEFHPIKVKAAGWGYEPAPLGKGAHIPIPDTPADIGSVRGALILFKIPNDQLESRPLRLEIESPTSDKSAEIILDV